MSKPIPTSLPDRETAPQRETAAGPASSSASAPASMPAKADAPASGAERQAPKVVMANARPSGIDFEDDTAKLFPSGSPSYRADMIREVMCHVIEGFNGRTRTKHGTYVSYRFQKHEVVALPKWFAVQHPTRLVIKE